MKPEQFEALFSLTLVVGLVVIFALGFIGGVEGAR